MKASLRYLLMVLLFGISLICCMTAEGEKTLSKLQQIASETPVYQGFVQIDSNHVIKSQRATLAFYYQSPASYHYEVRDFYIKELTERGWVKFEEDTYGGNTEGMEFRKGEYIISVFYSHPRDQDWDYSLNYTWERP